MAQITQLTTEGRPRPAHTSSFTAPSPQRVNLSPHRTAVSASFPLPLPPNGVTLEDLGEGWGDAGTQALVGSAGANL